MSSWLNDALKEHQKQEDRENKRIDFEEKRKTILFKLADDYINHSSILKIIAKYFSKINCYETAEQVSKSTSTRGFQYHVNSSELPVNYEFIDWKKEGYDPEYGAYGFFSGEVYEAEIKLHSGKVVCSVTLKILLCEETKTHEFTPIITIDFVEPSRCWPRDPLSKSFVYINPDENKLYKCLVSETSHFLKSLPRS